MKLDWLSGGRAANSPWWEKSEQPSLRNKAGLAESSRAERVGDTLQAKWAEGHQWQGYQLSSTHQYFLSLKESVLFTNFTWEELTDLATTLTPLTELLPQLLFKPLSVSTLNTTIQINCLRVLSPSTSSLPLLGLTGTTPGHFTWLVQYYLLQKNIFHILSQSYLLLFNYSRCDDLLECCS